MYVRASALDKAVKRSCCSAKTWEKETVEAVA
jgi:hypothetical protein